MEESIRKDFFATSKKNELSTYQNLQDQGKTRKKVTQQTVILEYEENSRKQAKISSSKKYRNSNLTSIQAMNSYLKQYQSPGKDQKAEKVQKLINGGSRQRRSIESRLILRKDAQMPSRIY